jgi:hypothetical protein
MRIRAILLMMAVLAIGTCAWAQEPTAAPIADGVSRDVAAARELEADSHPDLSSNDAWARNVVKGILILFGLAALIGPWVRRNVPEEVPPAHSHDEPPGASHHHGAGGTVNPTPHH